MNQERLQCIKLKVYSVTKMGCMEKVTEPRGPQVYGLEARRGLGPYRYKGAGRISDM